jgi:O-antigen ligase
VAAMAMGIIAGVLAACGEWAYAAGVIALPLMLRWPVQFTFGVYAFLIPFDNVSALGAESSGASLTRYMGFAVILILLSLGLATRRLTAPPRAALWWSLFVFWGALTFGWALDQQIVLERLPIALSLLLLYLVASSFRFTSKEFSAVLVMTVLGACAAAILATYGVFSGASFHNTGRSSLMIGDRETDPNSFSVSLLLPLSLSIGALIQSRRHLVRAGALIALTILGLAQLLTMSRGGLLAIITVVFVYVHRLKLNRRLLLATVSLLLLSVFMPSSFFDRLSLTDRGGPRMDIWTASLGLLPHHGLLGAGLGNFSVAYYSVAGSATGFHGLNRASHNIYLGTTVELGIIGLAFLFFAFREQLRNACNYTLLPYQAACWGMLAAGLTLDVVFRKFFWLCWILLAISTSLSKNNGSDTSLTGCGKTRLGAW